jgi:hypothetical protein
MGVQQIDLIELRQLLNKGWNLTKCAKHFKVSVSAISQAKDKLNFAIVKSVALESAHKVVGKNLNALDQLQSINQKANALLDRAEAANDNITQLSAMKEIRGQLGLQLELFKTLYDLQAVAEFQEAVLFEIGEVSKDVKDKIIARLKDRRALRRAINVN